jgi:hypothetical protein
MHVRPLLVPLTFLLSASAIAATDAPLVDKIAHDAALNRDAIRAAAISADIRLLADDALLGRDTGSDGERVAKRFVAARFAADGIVPVRGDDYFDPVTLRGDTVSSDATLTFGANGERVTDFAAVPDGRSERVDVEAAAVFVGYGVVAPEVHYDDLGDVDLHGKIAVILDGVPDAIPPEQRDLRGANPEKLKLLAARGAAGVLIAYGPEHDKLVPWPKFKSFIQSERLALVEHGEVANSPPGLALRALMQQSTLETIAKAAKVSTESVRRSPSSPSTKPIALGVMHGAWKVATRTLTSANVTGILRGSDPALAGEAVLYTAHVDHLGRGAPVDGDAIYHGAIDNASGVAALLEIAHAFARTKPKRSILFVVTTAEERGLLGAAHFVADPPVPLSSIVCDLNLDEVPGLAPLHDVVALGVERTTMKPVVDAAALSLGLRVSPDPEPEQRYFTRGDNFRFALAGVPALRLEPGDADARGDVENGRRLHREFVAHRYHSPKDQWLATDGFDAMADFARFAYVLGSVVADAPDRPRSR